MTDQPPPPPHQPESVPVTLARLEGKIDTALAVQTARVEEHSRRFEVVEDRLNSHSARLTDHGQRLAAMPDPTPKTSPWTVAATIGGFIFGAGSLLAVLITLIRVIPNI